MIKGLLYTSLSDFYNRIPVGRIVNRLTQDLGNLDEGISYCLKGFIACLFNMLEALVICVYASSPLVLIPIILVGITCSKLRVYYMKTRREVSRLSQINNSPIVSGAIAAINGLATIRAYGLQS